MSFPEGYVPTNKQKKTRICLTKKKKGGRNTSVFNFHLNKYFTVFYIEVQVYNRKINEYAL